MDKHGNSIFIVFSGFIIAIGRLLLESMSDSRDKDFAILLIMAIVNFVAFGFVLLFLNNDIIKYSIEKIDKTGVDSSIKKKRKFFCKILPVTFICVYLITGILYVIKYKSSYMNDFISILALAVSISANGLSQEIGAIYYSFIVKITSSKKNNKLKGL